MGRDGKFPGRFYFLESLPGGSYTRHMTRHCPQCGTEYALSGQPGRSESCERCGADLKVCLNCAHFDRSVAYQCRERRAEPVAEKHTANYCEYFEFVRRTWVPKDKTDSREEAARERMRKLFGD